MIINGYYLEFVGDKKSQVVKGEQAKEIGASLDKLNVLRARMYFEALGYKFRILSVEKHGRYKHVSFMKVK